MILLDNVQTWLKRARQDDLTKTLSAKDRQLLHEMSDHQLQHDIEKLFGTPVGHNETKDYGVIYRWYFATKWMDALSAVKPLAPIRLFEVAPGANDIIPKTVAQLYTHPQTAYITSNVDKKLTASFKKKTAELPIKIEVIEDAAQDIEKYVGDNLFDVVVFEHSVNDVLYAMLGEKAGIDVANSYWFDIVRQLSDIITVEYESGTLEQNAKADFLTLIQSCLNILKPGGHIIINHFMYENDLKRGINPELWRDLLVIVREWICTLDGTEISKEGFNPQWWMFFKKN